MRQLHSWHWISAALSLVGMLLFALTGLTLNHADAIPAHPQVTDRAGQLPASLLPLLAHPASADAPLPAAVAAAAAEATGLNPAGHPAEWSDDAAYVALPRPGGDAWVSIARKDGQITSEVTRRGWISLLNDLHKGRNAGPAWGWFIDLFALACVIFTGTGLLLLQLHARHRPSTWPIVGAGLLIPVLIAHFLVP